MSYHTLKYNLIMPSIAEMQITGFAMAGEKKIGKNLWRVEIWRDERLPKVYKDGTPQESVAACGPSVIALSNAVVTKYNSLMQIA